MIQSLNSTPGIGLTPVAHLLRIYAKTTLCTYPQPATSFVIVSDSLTQPVGFIAQSEADRDSPSTQNETLATNIPQADQVVWGGCRVKIGPSIS